MDGILLYAKQSGITSFTSLWAAKRAVNTTKIGHTGTLDNFADGLLVVLVDRMRKLTSHITDFDKTYEAIIRFGFQTDTLDIDGQVVVRASLPVEADFYRACALFTGSFEQLPPVYSAIRIAGNRASNLARAGKVPELKKRPVTIFSLDILAFTSEFAHIRVHCSKGTYIRSLARDLAEACGSCGYLAALRRTAVGPFLLSDAAGFDLLPTFNIAHAQKRLKHIEFAKIISPANLPEPSKEVMCASIQLLTPMLAVSCGFTPIFIAENALSDFLSGKKISPLWFEPFAEMQKQYAVFGKRSGVECFCGLIKKCEKGFSYVFVFQDEKPRDNPLKGVHSVHPKVDCL